jgi:hypothetical protein
VCGSIWFYVHTCTVFSKPTHVTGLPSWSIPSEVCVAAFKPSYTLVRYFPTLPRNRPFYPSPPQQHILPTHTVRRTHTTRLNNREIERGEGQSLNILSGHGHCLESRFWDSTHKEQRKALFITFKTAFNPFTASWDNAMSLSVPGVLAPCEKSPHTVDNFWPTELICNQFFFCVVESIECPVRLFAL